MQYTNHLGIFKHVTLNPHAEISDNILSSEAYVYDI